MGLETLSYAAFSHPPIFYCEKCGLSGSAYISLVLCLFALQSGDCSMGKHGLRIKRGKIELQLVDLYIIAGLRVV